MLNSLKEHHSVIKTQPTNTQLIREYSTQLSTIMSEAVKTPVKKATKAKKPKAPAAHPPVATMVVAAITALKERNGSSLAAIKKYMAANYKCDVAKLAPFIRKFLKKAVEEGKLKQVKASYKVDKTKLEKPKKPAKKQPSQRRRSLQRRRRPRPRSQRQTSQRKKRQQRRLRQPNPRRRRLQRKPQLRQRSQPPRRLRRHQRKRLRSRRIALHFTKPWSFSGPPHPPKGKYRKAFSVPFSWF